MKHLTNQKKSDRKQGFTIVEVMIVLSIAALIILIVFLAVPQLQRSSRNTQRNSDAYKLSSAVNECLSNNNGSVSNCLPSGAGASTSTTAPATGSGPILGSGGYLDLNKILQLNTITLFAPATVPTSVTGNVNGFPGDNVSAWVFSGYTCSNGTGFGSGQQNNYVVLYNAETSGNGKTPICVSP